MSLSIDIAVPCLRSYASMSLLKKIHYLPDGKAFTTGNSFYLLNDNIITDEGKVLRRQTRRFVG